MHAKQLAWLSCLVAVVDAQTQTQVAREMLAAHNALRVQVDVPPLVWSDRLAARAQQWAETLVARKRFYHRPDNPYGENLYQIIGSRTTAQHVVDDWAAEAPRFNHRANSCRGVCGHYTQIVWRESAALGCGVARDGRREIWVCDYDPPGNVVGERPY